MFMHKSDLYLSMVNLKTSHQSTLEFDNKVNQGYIEPVYPFNTVNA